MVYCYKFCASAIKDRNKMRGISPTPISNNSQNAGKGLRCGQQWLPRPSCPDREDKCKAGPDWGAGCGMAAMLWWWSRPQQRRDAKWSYCLAQVKHTAQRMPHSNSHTGLLWWWADRVLRVYAVYPTGSERQHRVRNSDGLWGMTATLEEVFPKQLKATSSSYWNDSTRLLHL